MPNLVRYRGSNSGRLHSHNIWYDCPSQEVVEQEYGGHYHFNDFREFDPPTIAGEATDTYYGIGDTGVTILALANQDNGIIEVAGNDADNDQSILVHGFEAGWARFSASDRVFFEARVAKASVADNALGFFLGFTEPENIAIGSVTLQDDSAAPDASEDFVGWSCLTADGDVAEPTYLEGGATLQHVGSGTTNAQGSGNDTTLVAATYYKLGLRWDGRRISYYVDGTRAAYYVPTSANSFPDVNHLSMIWTTKVGAAAESKAQLDWWAGVAYTL